jgi:hypothetical protein
MKVKCVLVKYKRILGTQPVSASKVKKKKKKKKKKRKKNLCHVYRQSLRDGQKASTVFTRHGQYPHLINVFNNQPWEHLFSFSIPSFLEHFSPRCSCVALFVFYLSLLICRLKSLLYIKQLSFINRL